MSKTDTITHLPLSDAKTLETLREVARDMEVALYRRYSKSESVEILKISEKELETLRTRRRIAHLLTCDTHVGFLGYQLLAYLLECVIPAGPSPEPSEASLSEPKKPAVNPDAKLMSVKDAVTLLGIGKTKFYAMMKTKEIEFVKIGQRTLIKGASLRRFTD